jgi:hypothetical protein
VVLVACSAFPAKDVRGGVGIPTWRTKTLTVLRPDDENAVLSSLLSLLKLSLLCLLVLLSSLVNLSLFLSLFLSSLLLTLSVERWRRVGVELAVEPILVPA